MMGNDCHMINPYNEKLGQSTGWVESNPLVLDGINRIFYIHQPRIFSFFFRRVSKIGHDNQQIIPAYVMGIGWDMFAI